ncbi:2895_t:CDS:2, partial [Gigaspora margarita]
KGFEKENIPDIRSMGDEDPKGYSHEIDRVDGTEAEMELIKRIGDEMSSEDGETEFDDDGGEAADGKVNEIIEEPIMSESLIKGAYIQDRYKNTKAGMLRRCMLWRSEGSKMDKIDETTKYKAQCEGIDFYERLYLGQIAGCSSDEVVSTVLGSRVEMRKLVIGYARCDRML